MARIVEDESLYESWKNVTAGKVFVKKIDRNGNIIDEVIPGGKIFHVTPTERRFNQEQAATDSLDFFQNGILIPIRLIETAEDVEKIKQNPNHITEDQMRAILKSRSLKAFQERLETITNPVALQRMMEIAVEQDATVKQVEAVRARLESVAPSLYSNVETYSTREPN